MLDYDARGIEKNLLSEKLALLENFWSLRTLRKKKRYS